MVRELVMLYVSLVVDDRAYQRVTAIRLDLLKIEISVRRLSHRVHLPPATNSTLVTVMQPFKILKNCLTRLQVFPRVL